MRISDWSSDVCSSDLGSAEVRLADAPINGGTGTKLTYAVKAQVGGKLAQIGARLIDGVAAKMADDFFSKFNAIVGGPAAAEGGGAAAQDAQAPEIAPEMAIGAAATTADRKSTRLNSSH